MMQVGKPDNTTRQYTPPTATGTSLDFSDIEFYRPENLLRGDHKFYLLDFNSLIEIDMHRRKAKVLCVHKDATGSNLLSQIIFFIATGSSFKMIPNSLQVIYNGANIKTMNISTCEIIDSPAGNKHLGDQLINMAVGENNITYLTDNKTNELVRVSLVTGETCTYSPCPDGRCQELRFVFAKNSYLYLGIEEGLLRVVDANGLQESVPAATPVASTITPFITEAPTTAAGTTGITRMTAL